MRFKKVGKAKVMNEKVRGSRRVAEVVSGNGHGYQGVENVSKGNIRPYPGAIRSCRSWKTGDIVEVFDDNTWKIATVLKVLKGGRYLVRPHEFCDEIKACKTSIRARQSWCDRKRIPVGKVLRTNEAEPTSAGSESQRRSFEKVDAFEDNNYMPASFNYSINGYYEIEKKKRKTYESDNDQCSVGSCSVLSDGDNELSSHYDADILSSDGESFNTSRVEHEIAVSVHRLELHAYRSTLEALYASGPLSWEKEALLTNLRINLHISNDEHLTELRLLISSGARILE